VKARLWIIFLRLEGGGGAGLPAVGVHGVLLARHLRDFACTKKNVNLFLPPLISQISIKDFYT
jgi:hypothetical protein